jgi:hypothetical protein
MPSSSAQLPCSLWPAADCELSWTRDAGIVSPSAAGLLVTELTTTFLLLMGFRAGPTWPLLVLGCAYFYSGLMPIPQLLSFPGRCWPSGRSQSTGPDHPAGHVRRVGKHHALQAHA